jgi:NAD(P)-dependent dehydrogenase (short-subunit alcohol dehydrogenase family)
MGRLVHATPKVTLNKEARAVSKLVEGKVAIVTGAASGIGQASAELFAKEGAKVVVADFDLAGAKETVKRIESEGGEAIAFEVDVTDEAMVRAMVEAAVGTFGRLDAAHNNAGISHPPHPFHETELSRFEQMMSINSTGVFLCMKHELDVMQGQRSGVIVNTSSGSGIIGYPGLAAYTASKHAVIGMTKVAALEYARQGVRINSVCPGTVDTPMMQKFIGGNAEIEAAMKATIPIGEFARPIEIAEAVVWMCSDRASMVSGESMLVDGASVCR